MAFLPMISTPTPQTDQLRQALVLQMLQNRAQPTGGTVPEAISGGLGQALGAVSQGLIGRMLLQQSRGQELQQAGARQAALQSVLGGSGIAPEMAQAIQGAGGGDALLQALVTRQLPPPPPPPITPYQQADLELERARMAQQQALSQASLGMQQQELAQRGRLAEQQLGESRAEREAKLAAGAQPKLPALSDVSSLRSQFIAQSKDFAETLAAYRRIKSAASMKSSAGDLGLIFNYMKMLDPGSTVRESEAAAVAASGSYGQQLQAWGAKLLTGERLTDAMRGDLLNTSDRIVGSQVGPHEFAEEQYKGIARRLGMDPSNVVVDYLGDLRRSLGAPAGGVPVAGMGMTQMPAAGGVSQEGATAVNPQTGERIVLRGGQWVPVR